MNMATKRRPTHRAYGEGSLTYRAAKKLWVARIELEPDDEGARRRLEKAFRLQADALEWMAKRKGEIAHYGRTSDPTITVAEWSKRWLEEICAPRIKASSLSAYRTNVDRWIVPTLGRRKLARVTPADVRAVSQAVRDAGRTSTTARGAHQVLSHLLESARREGLLTENVAKRVTSPAKQATTRGALSSDQTKAVLKTAMMRPDSALHLTMVFTGMRFGEVLGLTWECVNFDVKIITVAWQLREGFWEHGCGGACSSSLAGRCPTRKPLVPDGMPYRLLGKSYVLTPTKTGKTRAVPILPPLEAALRRHRDETASMFNPHDLVFHDDGKPLYAGAVRGAWREVVTSAGLPPNVTPHWARHSVATLLLEAGVDAKVVGEVVGHANIEMTRGTYQHVSSELARAGMAKFGELLSGD